MTRTVTQEDQAEAAMLDQIRNLENNDAPEPGTTHVGEVINDGTGDVPAPIIISRLESAGYAYVWDTETHECSVVNKNMIPSQLKKLRTNGKPYFTAQNPGILPERGTALCWLHPKSPYRKEVAQLGMASCRKSNLRNEYMAEQHMLKRHPAEYKTIIGMRERAEKQRNREEQQAQTAALRAQAEAMQAVAKSAAKRP